MKNLWIFHVGSWKFHGETMEKMWRFCVRNAIVEKLWRFCVHLMESLWNSDGQIMEKPWNICGKQIWRNYGDLTHWKITDWKISKTRYNGVTREPNGRIEHATEYYELGN